MFTLSSSLRKKCPHSELFWFIFSRIRTEYEEVQSISPYSVRMRENTDQNNSEYEHFSGSAYFHCRSFSKRKLRTKLMQRVTEIIGNVILKDNSNTDFDLLPEAYLEHLRWSIYAK